MWLAGISAGAAAAADQVPTSTYIAGLVALVSAALAAWLGARGTLRTADVQRETAFDRRQDDRNVYLENRNQELDAELTRYREMYVQLRLDVLAAGMNPDELGKGKTPGPPVYRQDYERLHRAVTAAGLNPDTLIEGASGGTAP